MPYIKQERREKIDQHIDTLVAEMRKLENTDKKYGCSLKSCVYNYGFDPESNYHNQSVIRSHINHLVLEMSNMNEDKTNINSGDLNYTITRICLSLLEGRLNYDNINTIIGVLTSVSQGFLRPSGINDQNVLLEFVLGYLIDGVCSYTPQSTQVYHSVIGVLECVKLEFYRRVAASYEYLKIMENKDVKEYEDFDQELIKKWSLT